MNKFPRQANFTDQPSRASGSYAVGAHISGGYWDSVFVEVRLETYVDHKFTEWMRNEVLGRLRPGGQVRVVISDGREN